MDVEPKASRQRLIPWFRRVEPEVDTIEFRTTGKRGQRTTTIVARKDQRGAQTGIRRVGIERYWRTDFYHRALTISWTRFMLIATGVYLLANVVFATLFLLQPGCIAGGTFGPVGDAFFFSVETFATIGYGVLNPVTVYANVVITFEALVGIMLVALTTGLMFARVSRPTARVLFAKSAVVAPYNGVPTLMIRMGNERSSQIVQATVTISMLRNERTDEGEYMRRFYDLKLERSQTPVFAMSYLALHRIDEASPLLGADAATLADWDAEILVTVTGLDETMALTVHARTSYLPDEVRFGHRYADIFGITPDGMRAIDYRRFHVTEALTQGLA